jgi:REP element-mobilizing transposase RayT
MSLKDSPHKEALREAGWSTRGYLPHFDGRAIPQFITLHLEDALPVKVVERWIRQLADLTDKEKTILLQRRIDRYLDQGYGECHLRNPVVARMVQNALLKEDGVSFKLFAWVVMPNHTHSLSTRFEELELDEIMRLHKSYTAHEANRLLGREEEFWVKDYFDRYIRNGKHFQNVVRYIENNPVKAGLCRHPEDWPFSSAWFRARGIKPK